MSETQYDALPDSAERRGSTSAGRSQDATAGTEFSEEDAVASKIRRNRWVKFGNIVGRVVSDPFVVADGVRVVEVKFLSMDRPFREVHPTLIQVRGLEPLGGEPQLGRGEAAAYAGITPSRLYQLRSQGLFGWDKREPFYATPTELDTWLAAPKAVSVQEAKRIRRSLLVGVES